MSSVDANISLTFGQVKFEVSIWDFSHISFSTAIDLCISKDELYYLIEYCYKMLEEFKYSIDDDKIIKISNLPDSKKERSLISHNLKSEFSEDYTRKVKLYLPTSLVGTILKEVSEKFGYSDCIVDCDIEDAVEELVGDTDVNSLFLKSIYSELLFKLQTQLMCGDVTITPRKE